MITFTLHLDAPHQEAIYKPLDMGKMGKLGFTQCFFPVRALGRRGKPARETCLIMQEFVL